MIFFFSLIQYFVQNKKNYRLLNAVIAVKPYSSPVSHTLDSQTSFVAQVRTGLFPPVDI